MTVPTFDLTDTAFLSQMHADQNELYHLMQSSSGESIPGMEGFFSRLINSISNTFQAYYNFFSNTIIAFEALFKQDWVLYCRRFIKRLNDNLPETEPFSGTISLRASRSMMEKNRVCLFAVANLIKRLDSNIVSSEKDVLTREMSNVLRYLEVNKCKIDIARPSASKAGTRFDYGELGRLGTAGYGTEPSIFVNAMARGVDDWVKIYEIFTDSKFFEMATKKMESEISKRIAAMDKAPDSKKAELATQINNMKARMVAFKSIFRASLNLWKTTLLADFVLPLQNMAQVAGMGDDLTSWILAPNEE